MSYLIASLSASNWDGIARWSGRALADGADLVEVRLDVLLGAELEAMGRSLPLTTGRWIATCRSTEEGGRSRLPLDQRLKHLRAAVRAGARFIDVEYASLQRNGGSIGDLDSQANADAPGIILSNHEFAGRPADLETRISDMNEVGGVFIIKAAWQCNDISDNFRALELMREAPGRRLVICMGEKGLLSRVLAHKMRAFGTYCCMASDQATAPGQPTLEEMLALFRWKSHTENTRLFGVIGAPVGHSLSPEVFNRQFAVDGIDAVYLPLRIDGTDELFRFLEGCRRRPWLHATGFSVTAPHKTAALQWAGEHAEPLAVRIGAANTLHFDGARVRALNTDQAGALAALAANLGAAATELGSLPVAVLGAGGAARAVIAGLCDHGCRVTVYNRSPGRAAELVRAFGCAARPWEERAKLSAVVVVNCTSAGMAPRVDDSPLPEDTLRPGMTVFDTVYNPRETRLLREARSAGCSTIDGVAMFVHQAAAQYQAWTGRSVDLDVMTRIVTDRLTARMA